jgi:predicted permease
MYTLGPFLESFAHTLKSLYPPLGLVVAGYVLARLGLLSLSASRWLAALVANFTLPALVAHRLLTGFGPQASGPWHWLPVSAWGIILLGIGISLPVGLWLARGHVREFVALGGLHNAGYLPLAMVAVLLPAGVQTAEAQARIMLYVLGISPVLWSLGVRLIGRSARAARFHRALINPVFLTLVVSLTLCLLGLNAPFLPVRQADDTLAAGPWAWVLRPAQMAGAATIPLALLVLGASLAHVPRGTRLQWPSLIGLAAVRLVAVPAIVIPVALLLPIPSTIRYIICLESCMPTAVACVVQARRFDGDADWVGHHMAATYVGSLLTVPAALTILKMAG